MWIWLSLLSAALLGIYDVAKKKALQKNDALPVLFTATAMSALFLLPFITAGSLEHHLSLMLKAILVTTSWVSGMMGLKLLPITTVSTIKGSRPIFVVLFSIILFKEMLNGWQWTGVSLALLSLFLISRTSSKELSGDINRRGMAWMAVSVLAGVASALYDKHIMADMEPLFVQCWSNVYITALLAICMLVLRLAGRKESRKKFCWDWTMVLIAVLITVSDCAYFFALKDEGALLSVISITRRGSIAVSFGLGAILFKERNLKEKSLYMALMLAAVTILLFGSK